MIRLVMTKIFEKISVTVLLLALLTLYGFTDISMKDVETAILNRDFEQAKEMATRLLAEDLTAENRHEVEYYAGLSELRLGNFDAARDIFSNLIDGKVSGRLRDKAYLGLFDVYYIDGRYNEALRTINRLIKVSPRSEFLSLIFLKSARSNLRLAHWDDARQYLKKITEDYPESLEFHVAKQLLNEKQYFAVQVGAFLDRHLAEKLTDELIGKGEYAYIVETVDKDDRIFYRVRVGQLVMLDKAQKLEDLWKNG